MYASWTTERAEQEIIRLCHSGLDSRSLRLAVFEKLQQVMPYEAFWCATIDPATMLFTGAVGGGIESQAVPALVNNEFLQADFNKFIALATSRQPVSTLQSAAQGELGSSRRYREILEPEGFGNEMRAVFRAGRAVWGAMCLHRLKRFEDFTPEHVALFAAIAPHLAAGLRSALLLNAVEMAPATDGPGLLLLADDLSVISSTLGAASLLDELCDWSEELALPLSVHALVATLHAMECNRQPTAKIPQVRARTRAGRWLTMHASRLANGSVASQIAIIIELATPNDVAPLVLQAYGMTAREQEVATLVLKGRSTEAISTQLCISVLTVQQHLKAIFTKIGVRSRREMVAQVFAQSYWPAVAEDQDLAPEDWSPV